MTTEELVDLVWFVLYAERFRRDLVAANDDLVFQAALGTNMSATELGQRSEFGRKAVEFWLRNRPRPSSPPGPCAGYNVGDL